MSKITLTQLKDYLPTSTINDLGITTSHQQRAWLKYFPKFIGRDLMSLIDSDKATPDLLEKVIPALASFTVFESIPFLDLVLTGTGFGIVSNNNIAPASAERVKNLALASIEAANNNLDELLYFVEKHDTYSADWNKSCIIRDGIVRNAEEFQKIYDINESRVKFYGHKRNLELFQAKRFVTNVGAAQLNDLVLKRIDTLVLPLLQTSIVHYALAVENIEHYATGDEFMKLAIRQLMDNKTKYPLYHSEMYEEDYKNTDDAYPVFG
jgi:hypothetical protein